MDKETLATLYEKDGYYWGTEPNELATRITDFVSPQTHPNLIDLGAGEGRDSVHLATQGFTVTAMDYIAIGLNKAKQLGTENHVEISTLEGDINDVVFPQTYDVVYSIGALQYIESKNRQHQFEHFKANTNTNGIHVLFAFLNHPDVAIAPDWGQNEYLYQVDELKSYYNDWAILSEEHIIFDCDSSGVPHQHAADILITQKSF